MAHIKKITSQNRQLLSAVNPFGAVDVNGNLCVFDNAREAYLFMMYFMMAIFPQGYVDVQLLLCRLTRLPQYKLSGIVGRRCMANFDWEDKAARNECLMKVFLILLRYTGCEFSDNAFQAALYEFDRDLASRLEKMNETLIQNKKNITIT